jgi:hypothetical protein
MILARGGHDGEGSPLEARDGSGSDSDTSPRSSDGDWDHEIGSMTSIESESDVFIHNPTTVRHLYSSFIPPILIELNQDEMDDFDTIADYIFQAS